MLIRKYVFSIEENVQNHTAMVSQIESQVDLQLAFDEPTDLMNASPKAKRDAGVFPEDPRRADLTITLGSSEHHCRERKLQTNLG